MEKSSSDTIDSNSMLCNALEQVKSKVRVTEDNINNKNESVFVALSRVTKEEKTNAAEHCIQRSIFVNILQTLQYVVIYSQ